MPNIFFFTFYLTFFTKILNPHRHTSSPKLWFFKFKLYFGFALSFNMYMSHTNYFCAVNSIINQFTASSKNHFFQKKLSNFCKQQKIWVKKVYLNCNISKSNGDFNPISFLSDIKKHLWQNNNKKCFILRKKVNLIHTTSRHTVRGTSPQLN